MVPVLVVHPLIYGRPARKSADGRAHLYHAAEAFEKQATKSACHHTHESGGDTMKRRTLVAGIALLSVAAIAGLPADSTAQAKVIKIGLSLPLTGADADGADAIMKGAQMAIAEINAKGGGAGQQAEGGGFQ